METRVSQRIHVLEAGTYGRHLAKTIERSVRGGSAGYRNDRCSKLLLQVYTARYHSIKSTLTDHNESRYLEAMEHISVRSRT